MRKLWTHNLHEIERSPTRDTFHQSNDRKINKVSSFNQSYISNSLSTPPFTYAMEKFSRWCDVTTGINPFVPPPYVLPSNTILRWLQISIGSAVALLRAALLLPLLLVWALLHTILQSLVRIRVCVSNNEMIWMMIRMRPGSAYLLLWYSPWCSMMTLALMSSNYRCGQRRRRQQQPRIFFL